jgi:hypothetical protein
VTAPLRLPYAAGSSASRRARVAVCSSLLVALSLSIFLWGKPAWRRAQLLYWQARSMKYQVPEGTVASSSDRPTIVSLEWANFYRLAGDGTVKSEGTVFLHERRSPGGRRRLVAVNVHDFGCFGGRGMVAHVFAPGSLFSRATEISFTGGVHPVEFAAVIYVGLPDPQDTSHFVIRYDLGKQSRVIDGWLTDDDRVLLEERHPSVACLTP